MLDLIIYSHLHRLYEPKLLFFFFGVSKPNFVCFWLEGGYDVNTNKLFTCSILSHNMKICICFFINQNILSLQCSDLMSVYSFTFAIGIDLGVIETLVLIECYFIKSIKNQNW